MKSRLRRELPYLPLKGGREVYDAKSRIQIDRASCPVVIYNACQALMDKDICFSRGFPATLTLNHNGNERTFETQKDAQKYTGIKWNGSLAGSEEVRLIKDHVRFSLLQHIFYFERAFGQKTSNEVNGDVAF